MGKISGDLVGLGSESRRVYLLVPQPGRSDLSEEEAQDLASAIHYRLFGPPYNHRRQLERLARMSASFSFPILYYSAWLIRQQEDMPVFWHNFHRAVVRNKLALATVQQQLAPLITNLWWKLHRECGIYRPNEGPSKVFCIQRGSTHFTIVNKDLEPLPNWKPDTYVRSLGLQGEGTIRHRVPSSEIFRVVVTNPHATCNL